MARRFFERAYRLLRSHAGRNGGASVARPGDVLRFISRRLTLIAFFDVRTPGGGSSSLNRLRALLLMQINGTCASGARFCQINGAGLVPLSDIILFAHPTFGVLAILARVWVLVEL
jgi:hypothetical protein